MPLLSPGKVNTLSCGIELINAGTIYLTIVERKEFLDIDLPNSISKFEVHTSIRRSNNI